MSFQFSYALARRKPRIIDLDPVYSVFASAEDFIKMYEQERDTIDSVRTVPGRLGSKFLGGFLVLRKRPVYTVLDESALALR